MAKSATTSCAHSSLIIRLKTNSGRATKSTRPASFFKRICRLPDRQQEIMQNRNVDKTFDLDGNSLQAFFGGDDFFSPQIGLQTALFSGVKRKWVVRDFPALLFEGLPDEGMKNVSGHSLVFKNDWLKNRKKGSHVGSFAPHPNPFARLKRKNHWLVFHSKSGSHRL